MALETCRLINISGLPFNTAVGIREPDEENPVLMLPFSRKLTIHPGTMRPSAIFALAEASGGEVLIPATGEGSEIGRVVCKTVGKYSAPAMSDLFSRSETSPDEIQKGWRLSGRGDVRW